MFEDIPTEAVDPPQRKSDYLCARVLDRRIDKIEVEFARPENKT